MYFQDQAKTMLHDLPWGHIFISVHSCVSASIGTMVVLTCRNKCLVGNLSPGTGDFLETCQQLLFKSMTSAGGQLYGWFPAVSQVVYNSDCIMYTAYLHTCLNFADTGCYAECDTIIISITWVLKEVYENIKVLRKHDDIIFKTLHPCCLLTIYRLPFSPAGLI